MKSLGWVKVWKTWITNDGDRGVWWGGVHTYHQVEHGVHRDKVIWERTVDTLNFWDQPEWGTSQCRRKTRMTLVRLEGFITKLTKKGSLHRYHQFQCTPRVRCDDWFGKCQPPNTRILSSDGQRMWLKVFVGSMKWRVETTICVMSSVKGLLPTSYFTTPLIRKVSCRWMMTLSVVLS